MTSFKQPCPDCNQEVVFNKLPDLPYGWEEVVDPHLGVYYIDHTTKRTQYEKPYATVNDMQDQDNLSSPYKHLLVELVKGRRGFGFTIVGDECSRWLQVNAIAADSPAADAETVGLLAIGDIVQSVNGRSLYGSSPQDLANIFRDIPVGEKASLNVCRGYPLYVKPDCHDVDYDVITTTAITRNSNDALQMFSRTRQPLILSSSTNQLLTPTVDQLTHLTQLDHSIIANACNEYVQLLPDADQPLPDITQCSTVPDIAQCAAVQTQDSLQTFAMSSAGEHAQHVQLVQHVQQPDVLADMMSANDAEKLQSISQNVSSKGDTTQHSKVAGYFCDNQINVRRLRLSDGLSNIPLLTRYGSHVNDTNQLTFHRETSLTSSGRDRLSSTSSNGSMTSQKTGRSRHDSMTSNLNRNFQTSPNLCDPQCSNPSSPNQHVLGNHMTTSTDSSPTNRNSSILPQLNELISHNRQADDLHEFTLSIQPEDEGFGLRVVGGIEGDTQVTVGEVLPGGAAERDGRVRPGDRILCVDGASVIGASHHLAVEMMKRAASVGTITLLIHRPEIDMPDFRFGTIPDTIWPTPQTMPPQDNGVFELILCRGPRGYGFSVRGGREFGNMPFSILHMVPGGAAQRCGLLQVGDLIISVNGVSTASMRHADIVSIIQSSGRLHMLLKRPSQGYLRSFFPASAAMDTESHLHHPSLPLSRFYSMQ